MKKHTKEIFEEFKKGNYEPLKKIVSFLNNYDSASIYMESQRDDFNFYWNKFFIEGYIKQEVKLSDFPSEIEKNYLLWVREWIKRSKELSLSGNKRVIDMPKKMIEKEVNKLVAFFKFLNLDEEKLLTISSFSENILPNVPSQITSDFNTKALTNTIFYLGKIDYLKNLNGQIKSDIKMILNCLYRPLANEKNKEIFNVYISSQKKNIDDVIEQKVNFFKSKNELVAYVYFLLCPYKEDFIEALNEFGGIRYNSDINLKNKVYNKFNELIISEGYKNLNNKITSTNLKHKKLKI